MSEKSVSQQNFPRGSRINQNFPTELDQNRVNHNFPNFGDQNQINQNFQNLNIEMDRPLSLRDRCYPTRTVQPSIIVLPLVEGNFELKHSFIQGVPKFTGSENAYEFLSEYELYSSTTQMQQLSNESIKLRLIPFALLESAKR